MEPRKAETKVDTCAGFQLVGEFTVRKVCFNVPTNETGILECLTTHGGGGKCPYLSRR